MPIVLSDGAQNTVAALVEAVFTHLEPSSLGYLNRVATPVTADATQFVFDLDVQAAVTPGAYLCVDVEVVYVWSYDAATKTAQVQRGMLGSVPSDHAAGALVQIQPRVTNFDVLNELRNEIRSWPPGLYRTVRLPVNVGMSSRGYDLAASNLYRVLEARYTGSGAPARALSRWHVDHDANTTTYPSGKAIVFADSFSTGTVEVVYAAPFVTDPWALTTNLTSIGLADSMRDIPVLGAASRLMREAPRTDTRAQGQSRLAEEVPPMHTANTRTSLRREANTRIDQEIMRLREKYPQRRQ